MEQPPPTPYGPPPPGGYVNPPPPPVKRRRPSAWWFAVAVVVLLGSIGGGITGLVFTAADTFGTDGTAPNDGSTESIATTAEEYAFIWATSQMPERCSIVDSVSGEEVTREPVTATYTKTTGGRTWTVVGRFDAGSGQLDVTCPPDSSSIQLGPATEFGKVFGSFALFIGLLVVGGLIGFVMLIVVTVLYATGRPRREAAGPKQAG